MNFEKFQSQAALYVLGALDLSETRAFERSRKHFGQKGEAFIQQCQALDRELALKLRPPELAALIKARLLSMVRRHQQS